MTLDEFYNLSKDESFERIKGECRTQAKRRLCGSLICLLLLIVLIVCIVILKPQEFEYYTNTFYICMLSVFCLAAGWFAVDNYRLLYRVDSLDTPEQLLHWYEKTINNKRKVGWLIALGCISAFYPEVAYNIKYFDWIRISLDLTFKVAIIVFWLYAYYKGYLEDKSRRDEDIIDRLEDLIDRK